MAETSELKVGDVVQLNSGSPSLTVTELHQGGETVAVAWHDDHGAMQKAVFPTACVKKVVA